MREKAEQGYYPGRASFGYRNNSATRNIEPHPENRKIVFRAFELCASGRFSITALCKEVYRLTGRQFHKSSLCQMLGNPIYFGSFIWRNVTYQGKHEALVTAKLFAQVQSVLDGRSRPHYSKHDLAFRGLLTCAHDNCMVTAELAKAKYVYYRCTGHRGKCALPRFREQEIAEILGQLLRDIQVPAEVVLRIEESLLGIQTQMRDQVAQDECA